MSNPLRSDFDRNTTEPTKSDSEPTIPTESGEQEISPDSINPSDAIYGNIVRAPLPTPSAPFFTERPEEDFSGTEFTLPVVDQLPIITIVQDAHSEFSAIERLALANRFGITSIPPEDDHSSTQPDELAPEQE